MKKQKPLTKQQYMAKFSRSARWRLGAVEAEEAINDYREMVFEEERKEETLVEELGDPVQAAWLLTEAREYKRWLWVFGILTLGLALCAIWNWSGLTFFWFSWDYALYGEAWRCIAVLAVGIVLSQLWFRRYGRKSGTLSARLLLALTAVGIFVFGTMALSWYVFGPKFLDVYAETYPRDIPWQIILQRELILDGGLACVLIAPAGLIMARCYDRRWLALYTLALTAAVLCIMMEFWLHSMDLTYAMLNDTRGYVFSLVVPVGAVGLIGTGVALC